MEFKKHRRLSLAEDKDSSHNSQQLKFENVVGNNLQVKDVSVRCLMIATCDLVNADLMVILATFVAYMALRM